MSAGSEGSPVVCGRHGDSWVFQKSTFSPKIGPMRVTNDLGDAWDWSASQGTQWPLCDWLVRAEGVAWEVGGVRGWRDERLSTRTHLQAQWAPPTRPHTLLPTPPHPHTLPPTPSHPVTHSPTPSHPPAHSSACVTMICIGWRYSHQL